jgi:ATP-dependent helicase YprA (DUF1998 family)
MELRPYQQDVIAEFDRKVTLGQRRVIVVAPTGAGKTIVAAEIIRQKVAACLHEGQPKQGKVLPPTAARRRRGRLQRAQQRNGCGNSNQSSMYGFTSLFHSPSE